MAKMLKSLCELVGAALVGIIGGLLVAAILDSVISPKCPVCKHAIPKSANSCLNCKTALQWV